MRWRYRDTVLALCTLAFFVTMVGRLAISPVVPDLTTEFGVSNGLIGLALTGMWMTYALAQFPSGVLADRYGERIVILASIAGTGATSLLIVAAPRFAVFVLGTVLLGAAAGLHYSVATTLLARTYDDLGTAVGLHNGGAPAAGLLTPVVVSWIAVRYGWRPAVGITVVVAVPALALFARGVRPTDPRRPEQPMRERLELGPILDLLTRPSIVFTGAIAIICDFTWQGVASFLPTFLDEFRGYSSTFSGTLFAVYFVTQGVLQVAVGNVADRFGRDTATALCMGAGIAGFGLLVAGPGLVAVSTGIVLLGIGMGWGAAVMPRFMDHLSDEERGAGFGLIRTVYMVVAATGSVATGTVADQFGWAASFTMLAALMAIVLALLGANWLLDRGY